MGGDPEECLEGEEWQGGWERGGSIIDDVRRLEEAR